MPEGEEYEEDGDEVRAALEALRPLRDGLRRQNRLFDHALAGQPDVMLFCA